MNKTKVIFILIAAAALSAVVWFLAQPDGSIVLLQAQKNLAEAKTLRYEVELDVVGVWARKELPLGGGEDPIHFKGTVRTDIDRNDPVLPASSSHFDLSLSSQDSEFLLRGDARKKDGRHYLRLQEASMEFFPGIERAIGKWVYSDDPFIEFLVPKEETELEEFPLDGEAIKELETGFSTIPIFRHIETLAPEKLDGAENLHYRIGINSEAVAALLLKKKELATGVEAEAEEFIELLAQVSTWGEVEGEIWIGKKDRRIRRLDLKTTLPEELGGAVISTKTFMTRYGEAVSVEAPEAEDVLDLFGRILIGRLDLAGERDIKEAPPEEDEAAAGLVPAEGEEAGAETPVVQTGDSDGDGLSDASESFYGSDAWNPDSDGDGWSDGVEVANGRDPMGPGVLFGFGL